MLSIFFNKKWRVFFGVIQSERKNKIKNSLKNPEIAPIFKNQVRREEKVKRKKNPGCGSVNATNYKKGGGGTTSDTFRGKHTKKKTLPRTYALQYEKEKQNCGKKKMTL